MQFSTPKLLLVLTLAASPVFAIGQTTTTSEPRTLDTVVVSGQVRGPGFWQVYKDDQHDLWIMGTLSPRPGNIQWDAAEAKRLVSDADLVLWPAIYGVDIKSNIFQQLGLGYGYLKAQKNPDGKTLKEVISPALYSRWEKAKAIYMPHNGSVERQRPLTAAQDILDAAMKQARLSKAPLIVPAIGETIKVGKIPQLQPQFIVHLTTPQAKAALADVRQQNLDDTRCLEATLDAIDQDMPRMVANANAWAIGDIDSLSFNALAEREALCADAMMNPEFSAKHGLPNIPASITAEWLKEAEKALSTKGLTVAFLPIENLVGPSNVLDMFRAKGYTVNGP
jgi:hypothetical protein